MATKTKKTAKTQTAPAQNAAVPAGDLTKRMTVRKDLKFRGARQAWYERALKYDGKPLGDYVKDVTDNRPSTYGARSMHAGQPEPVSGWVRFFIRNGYFTLA